MQLLLLVLVHPQDSTGSPLLDVHLVVGCKELLSTQIPGAGTDSSLLAILVLQVLASLGELVPEACHKALVQVVVVDRVENAFVELCLIQHFANQDPVDSDSSLSTKVHDGRVSVALLEEEVLVVIVNELVFNMLHAFFYSLQHQVVPVWT